MQKHILPKCCMVTGENTYLGENKVLKCKQAAENAVTINKNNLCEFKGIQLKSVDKVLHPAE